MRGLRLTRQQALLATGLLAVVVLLAILTPAGMLMLSPAVALLVLLGAGLFPSEELIARLRRRLRRARRTPLPPVTAPRALHVAAPAPCCRSRSRFPSSRSSA